MTADFAALLRRTDYRSRWADPTAGDPLTSMFRNGASVDATRLDAADVATCVAASTAESDGGVLRPLLRVTPWDDLLVAHDPDRPSELEPDTVLGVNNTTRTLAALTPRRRVHRALDVATGSAGPAIRLAGHADVVVATDLSEHALRYASRNAAMNGVYLDLRQGDLFEPVAHDPPFDLITANLPFVVSPDATFTFRDGGRVGDDLCRTAVRAAAAHLAREGIAVLLCSWLVPTGTAPADRVVGWLDDVDIGALVLPHSSVEPDTYARKWNEYLLVRDPAAFRPTVERWVAAFDAWGADAVATGAVVLHRGRHRWRRVLTLDGSPSGDGGSQILRIVADADGTTRSDEQIAATIFALVAPHRLEQSLRYDGAWVVDTVRMVLDDTAGITGSIDPLAVHVILRLDGARPLSTICDEAASDLGLDAEEVRASVIRTCRDLAERGCLRLVR